MSSGEKMPTVTDQDVMSAKRIEEDSSVVLEKDTVTKIDSDLDVGALYANQLNGDSYSRKEEVSLRWRLDRRIMPIVMLNVILASCDKTSSSTGALYGLKTDCDLTGNRYSWVGSAFYFGYLVASLPAAWLLQRLPIAKFTVGCQLVWGIILIATGFVSNFPGLLALRILLGIFEAPIIPGNLIMIGMWYPRKEQALRLGIFYTGFAQLITGPVGYGVGYVTGTWFKPWRLFFWIIGSITIIWAFFISLVLPDSPVSAKFLSEREKAIIVDRMRADQIGIENKTWKWAQFREALLDVKTWLLVLFNLWVSIPNGGLTSFTPLIVNGLGYSSQRAALLTMPSGILETVSSYLCNGCVFLLVTRLPKYHPRGVIIIIGLIVGMIAAIFLYTLPLTALHNRLAALYVSYFYLGPYIVSLGFITANTAGHTKKVTVNALVFISYCVSNIIGPQFFKSNQAPLYPLGTGAILGAYVLSIITMCTYMAFCWHENQRRDKLDTAGGELAHQETDFKDLTDKENIHFRYVW
ncbi:putative allantoate permease [Mollisia scopiformis]|uniref:Putative allantoate permease n=1 Tax=Mollisia scopiformis TaxID=149040 RepID=A0A194XJJ7_MOLSC|nr:putative allantoate permease [Mollisia scopiformis]KUJ20301.1 putative allantoate permease [Mollisia scopiformis]